MQENPVASSTSRPTRRDFIKTSTAAAVGAAVMSGLALDSAVYAGSTDELKIGLIGCGGRGTGAAANCLRGDPHAKLVALGDMFKDQFDTSLDSLKQTEVADRVAVTDDKKFTGWDAYKGVIDSVDVVLLATPPHFRPMHLKAAVEAGKHVFCEKPVAVDAPGVRSVMETVKMAADKKLTLVSGLCYRYDSSIQETVKRVHDGAIGEIVALNTNYLTTGLWYKPRKPEWSDLEWQLRDWLYFTWLSGDHIVEQHIHSLDKILWVMQNEPPLKVTASGGRTVRTGAQFGNVYDHFNSTFEWPKNLRCFAGCRQWSGAEQMAQDVSDWAYGTEGVANIQQHRITGKNPFHKGDAKVQMYDAEHVAMFDSIRNAKAMNNGDYMCKATLMAIMARESAYTGKTITWEQALNSQEKLGPEKYEFGPLPVGPIAVPGETKFS